MQPLPCHGGLRIEGVVAMGLRFVHAENIRLTAFCVSRGRIGSLTTQLMSAMAMLQQCEARAGRAARPQVPPVLSTLGVRLPPPGTSI